MDPVGKPQETDPLELTLRPKKLAEYIGQQQIKEHLLVHLAAARGRKEPLGHTLLHGPPGLGKTTLAYVIAHEMGAQVRVTSGPAIEKAGDVASLLTNLEAGDILFIDEIHRLRPQIEEVLYAAMEDCVLDIMIGKGPTARSVRLTLQPFTLIGATTKAGSMSAPLRDRFLHSFKLSFYELPDLQCIVERSAHILGVALEPRAAHLLAQASRATPRICNRLVRAARDFAQVRAAHAIAEETVQETLATLQVDGDGLDATDRRLLQVLTGQCGGGPVGLSTLAAILAEEEETIESVTEPYLMQQGLLMRTPKGRVATMRAFEKLNIAPPRTLQAEMFVHEG
jgi:Holliday junction DNA helicase RuvB